MRSILIALVLSAGPLAIAQSGPHTSPTPSPAPCKSTLPFIAPSSTVCLQLPPASGTDSLAVRPAPQPDIHVFLVSPSESSPQAGTPNPNPFPLYALNQPGPQVAPNISPRGKAEPIPTTFPNALVEKIPTAWPNLKLMLINQPPPANAAAESKQK